MTLTLKQRRTEYLAAGNCAFCGYPRATYDYLCDDCEKTHRERQRVKPKLIVRPCFGKFATFKYVGGKLVYLEPFETEQEADNAVRAILAESNHQGD